ncbi:flagellin, partial [bacterium]|nr:flagellin [bacterium]
MNMKISNILLKNIRDFQTSLERMVTGLKINKPADDPAGFFVASRFNTQIKGLENANTNIQTALTMLKVADESMGEINDILNKMRDLIQKGCNGYLTPQERELNQKQINDLFARAVEIKNGAESNGIKLFDGGSTKLDKNKTYMDGQEVVVAAGQVLTTTGKLLIDYTGTGEIIEPEAGTAWGRPEATEESESVILNEGEESQGAEPESVILSESEESQGAEPESVILNEGEESQGTESESVILSESEESQGTESESVILNEGEESQGAEASTMMMSRSMSTFAMTRSVDAEDLGTEGTREFAAGETATVKINGMTYTITNNDTENATTLYYSTNNGQIVLGRGYWEDSFTVTAADGQDDNISLRLGDYSVINTGDGNDTVDVDWACGRIWVNTGAGNDTVEINGGYDVRVDLGDGEDNLINNQGYLHFVQRSEGTDTISGSTDNVFVYDEIY